MGRFLGRRDAGRGQRRADRERRRRRAALEVSRLESRDVPTINAGLTTVLINPGVLPPTSNGKPMPVSISGVVATSRTENPAGFFFVTDEYRRYEPHGPVALTPAGTRNGNKLYSYAFTINFPTNRSTNTPDGRHYDLFVGATDRDGASGRTVEILVPKTYPPPANMPYPNPNPWFHRKAKVR